MNTADVSNPAGARAYSTPDRELIGRLVLESRTAPTDSTVITRFHSGLMSEESPAFIRQCVLYSIHKAHNRDIAMALLAFMYARAKSFADDERKLWFDEAKATLFDTVLDLSHLRSFLAYYRGPSQQLAPRWGYATGIGGRLQKDLKQWINQHPLDKLIKGKVGTCPTTRDIFRMVHPGTSDVMRNNVYHWIVKGVTVQPTHPLINELDGLRAGEIPDPECGVWRLPADILLPAMGSSATAWACFGQNLRIRPLLKQLNTLARHDAYTGNPGLLVRHCQQLEDATAIEAAGISAYEVYRATQNVNAEVPAEIKASLEATLENSLANVTRFEGRVIVLLDVSGSMQMPLGHYRGKPSALRCCDAAALITATIAQAGSQVMVVPFDTAIRNIQSFQDAEGVKGKADAIAGYMGGGTNVGMAFEALANCGDATAVVLVSDNQSLRQFDLAAAVSVEGINFRSATRAQLAWNNFRQANEGARLLLMDVDSDGTQQIADDISVTGLSGWSPATFSLVDKWLQGIEPGDDAPEVVDIVAEISNFRLEPTDQQG